MEHRTRRLWIAAAIQIAGILSGCDDQISSPSPPGAPSNSQSKTDGAQGTVTSVGFSEIDSCISGLNSIWWGPGTHFDRRPPYVSSLRDALADLGIDAPQLPENFYGDRNMSSIFVVHGGMAYAFPTAEMATLPKFEQEHFFLRGCLFEDPRFFTFELKPSDFGGTSHEPVQIYGSVSELACGDIRLADRPWPGRNYHWIDLTEPGAAVEYDPTPGRGLSPSETIRQAARAAFSLTSREYMVDWIRAKEAELEWPQSRTAMIYREQTGRDLVKDWKLAAPRKERFLDALDACRSVSQVLTADGFANPNIGNPSNALSYEIQKQILMELP